MIADLGSALSNMESLSSTALNQMSMRSAELFVNSWTIGTVSAGFLVPTGPVA